MTKQPQDRKPRAAEVERTEAEKAAAGAEEQRKAKELVASMMTSGIDFSPLIVDIGDGVRWEFNPDPMPSGTARLNSAMRTAGSAVNSEELDLAAVERAFEELVSALRGLLLADSEDFPLPQYGTKSLLLFAMKVATGRDGFPTE